MATKFPFEERTRVLLVPTIADISAPTDTELDGGVDITCFLTKDGLNPGGSTNGVDAGSLCSRIDSQVAGSVSYSFTLRGFRYADDDDFWDAVAYGTSTHVVVRRGPAFDAAWEDGQPVEVYKGQFGEKIPAASAANTMQTFEVSLFVEDADLDAAVDAA